MNPRIADGGGAAPTVTPAVSHAGSSTLTALEKARDLLVQGVEECKALFDLPAETELQLEDAISEVDRKLSLAFKEAS